MITKAQALLDGLHGRLALAGEDSELANAEMRKFFPEVLADLSDKEAIGVLAQALAIEACTAAYLQRRLTAMGN